ncbi:MAG TPA: hypothetical protein VGH72_33720 [Pseudonocardia sp.]|jgi:hypothetical protein
MTAIDPSKIITYRAWWPASVLLPDGRVLHRTRAYATSIGLLVYASVPSVATPEWGGLTPDWWSPIDFAATVKPASSLLPGRGTDIQTAAGLAVVTFTGGCGCGSRLKQWRPSFSTQVAMWPAPVSV